MIYVYLYNDGFKIEGHANYAEAGYDIVCSAISAISFGSIDWFNKEDIILFESDEEKPMLKLKLKITNHSKLGLSLVKHQMIVVFDSYPKNIKLKQLDSNMEV